MVTRRGRNVSYWGVCQTRKRKSTAFKTRNKKFDSRKISNEVKIRTFNALCFKCVPDMDFADDISAISHSLAGIQEITNNIETFGAKIGLRINCEKIKAMKIGPVQNSPILIMHQNVDYVEKFPYLGSYMSNDGDSEPDLRARIGKAASIFQRLRPIWSSTTINLNVKLRLYAAIVIPMAIYACEMWKRTAMIAHRLDVFNRRCLRAIICISWRDHVTNQEVTRRAGMERLQYIVTTKRRKWLATFSDCREKD